MDISNRALGLLLVAAIVISIGGTVISLNKLDGFSTTGFATNPNGTVTLTVGDTMSIVLDDAAIDFGTCTIPSGQSLDVDSALAQAGLNNSACSATAGFPDLLDVRNNGNVNTNVTITSNITGTNLFNDGTDSWIAYKGANAGAGCTGTQVTSYTNITSTSDLALCDLLQADLADNSAELSIRSHLSQTATSGGVMKLTFTAHVI